MRNQSDCASFYSKLKGSGPNLAVLAAILVPVLLLVLLSTTIVTIVARQRSRASRLKLLFNSDLKQNVRMFTLPEIRRATGDFSQVIGRGGYGSVYRAVLKDKSVVAVKRLDQQSKQGDDEFIREVELLSRLHHRHLVNLVGFCADKDERILVYEYMGLGSLYEHIHGPNAVACPLSWESRTKIAIHVALGIEYLHYGADPPLIHRDIKSSNILLSEDGFCKVSDFGLCKVAPLNPDYSEQLTPTATAVKGSFGYLDPEYISTSVLSEKSDVYSYGVFLLELISGHKSIHEWQPLALWAGEYLEEPEKNMKLLDSNLKGACNRDELELFCDIAKKCVQYKSSLRPTIREIARMLVDTFGHSGSFSVSDAASMASTEHGKSQSVSLVSGSVDSSATELSFQRYSNALTFGPEFYRRVSDGKVGSVPHSGPIRIKPIEEV